MTAERLLKRLAAWQHKSADIKMNSIPAFLPTISITWLNLEPYGTLTELKSGGFNSQDRQYSAFQNKKRGR